MTTLQAGEKTLVPERDAGLSEARIFYVIEIAAMYSFTNRIMSAYGIRPDDDFMNEIGPRT